MTDEFVMKSFLSVLKGLGVDELSTELNTQYGTFKVRAHEFDEFEYPIVSLAKTLKHSSVDPIVRIHSACLFGESFLSNHCDCQAQLAASMAAIQNSGGVVVYVPQEGRGAGLCAKIVGMEIERLSGADTADAFRRLGLVPDLRDYKSAVDVLRQLSVTERIQLITNNPTKVEACERAGFQVAKRIEPKLELTPSMYQKIRIKQRALGHHIYAPCNHDA